MSRTDDMVQEAQTIALAADWLARLQDEAAGADEWLAFENWLAASPAHVMAYEQVEDLWSEIDDLAPQLRLALTPEPQPARRPVRAHRGPAPGLTRRRWLAAGLATAAGVGGVILLRTGVTTPLIPSGVIYEARPGQTRDVTLADGTRMRLNAGSHVSVSLDRDARRVVMADAEAVFDVAHDPNRPFLIRVGDSQVRVVGTEFNLRRRLGKVVLTVRRGVVEVRPAGKEQAAPLRLAAGDQLTHMEASDRSVLNRVDPEEAFGWTEGRLIYRDEPLAGVAADLQRRFGHVIRTADSEVARTPFTGVLVMDQEQAVLQRLAALAPIEVSRQADGVVVLRRRD